jgi:single-stranded DNA-binding protein
MSLFALATGTLLSDPVARQGQRGEFATAALRSGQGDEAVIVNVIAFGETAERLLALHKGDSISAQGRAELRSWIGRDGAEKHGLGIVAEQIATLKPHPKPRGNDTSASRSRRRSPYAGHTPPAAIDDRAPLDDQVPL